MMVIVTGYKESKLPRKVIINSAALVVVTDKNYHRIVHCYSSKWVIVTGESSQNYLRNCCFSIMVKITAFTSIQFS